MPKTYQFTKEQYEEVKEQQRKTTDAKLYKRLEILQLRMEGYKNSEIAKITKYSKSRVSALICLYAKKGIAYFQEEHRKGGNKRNISYQEESEMLEGFKKQAEVGQLIETSEIKAAYEKKVGHQIGGGQIYCLLKRHGWRKIMPRSQHLKKASEVVQDFRFAKTAR